MIGFKVSALISSEFIAVFNDPAMRFIKLHFTVTLMPHFNDTHTKYIRTIERSSQPHHLHNIILNMTNSLMTFITKSIFSLAMPTPQIKIHVTLKVN